MTTDELTQEELAWLMEWRRLRPAPRVPLTGGQASAMEQIPCPPNYPLCLAGASYITIRTRTDPPEGTAALVLPK